MIATEQPSVQLWPHQTTAIAAAHGAIEAGRLSEYGR
jgi:hypothetical protein